MESVTLYSSPFRHSLPSNMGMKSYAAMIAVSLIIVTIYKTYALFWAGATFLKAQAAWNRDHAPHEKKSKFFSHYKNIYIEQKNNQEKHNTAKQCYESAVLAYNEAAKNFEKERANKSTAEESYNKIFQEFLKRNSLSETEQKEVSQLYTKAAADLRAAKEKVTMAETNLTTAGNIFERAKDAYQPYARRTLLAQQAFDKAHNENPSAVLAWESLRKVNDTFVDIRARSSAFARAVWIVSQFALTRLHILPPNTSYQN